MATTSPPFIPTLPLAPDPANRSTFDALAYAWSSTLGPWSTQMQALGVNVKGNADEALAAANNAAQANIAAQTAAQAALNSPGTSAASATALSVSTGQKSMTITTGKAFAVGQYVQIVSRSNTQSWMLGAITSHDPTSGALGVLVTQCSGTGTLTDWTVVPGSPLTLQSLPTLLVITASMQWTCPVNVTRGKVTLQGGGASAGNAISQVAMGGHGGGTAIKQIVLTPGGVYTATVGAGGLAVPPGLGYNTAGNAGGASSFVGPGVSFSADGGNQNAPGGGNGGDINIYGGFGSGAPTNSSTPASRGGSSFFCGATEHGWYYSDYGGGSAGRYNNLGSSRGGHGLIILEY